MNKYFDELNLEEWELRRAMEVESYRQEIITKARMLVLFICFLPELEDKAHKLTLELLESSDESIEQQQEDPKEQQIEDAAKPPEDALSAISIVDEGYVYSCHKCGHQTQYSSVELIVDEDLKTTCLTDRCLHQSFIQYGISKLGIQLEWWEQL